MEQLVAELKKILPLQEITKEGDIVVVAAKNPQMLVYARVGTILRDQTRKVEWWHVTLHLLTIPLQTVTWTLRLPQFTGQEIFTMGGEGRFIQAVHFTSPPIPVPPVPQGEGTENKRPHPSGLRIVK